MWLLLPQKKKKIKLNEAKKINTLILGKDSICSRKQNYAIGYGAIMYMFSIKFGGNRWLWYCFLNRQAYSLLSIIIIRKPIIMSHGKENQTHNPTTELIKRCLSFIYYIIIFYCL